MRALPFNDPVQQAAQRAWAKTTRTQREAFHRFTCLNSREPVDMQLVDQINRMVVEEAKKVS